MTARSRSTCRPRHRTRPESAHRIARGGREPVAGRVGHRSRLAASGPSYVGRRGTTRSMPAPTASHDVTELSGCRASVRDRARSPARTRSPAVLRRAGHPPAGRHVRRAGSRDHRRLRRARHHHRGRGGQGARRRADRRAGHARRSGHGRSRRRSSRSPASPTAMVAGRAAARAGAAVGAGVPRGHGARGAQRARSTPVSCAPPASAHGQPGRGRRCCAPRGSPAAVLHPGRGTQRAAGRAGPSCSAPPPRPTTGRSPTPGPPSRCCTGCWSGSATSACRASRSCSRWPATRRRTGPPRTAAQTPPGRGRAVRAGRVPVPRAARRGALRRHQRRPAAPGAQLLHRGRAAAARARHGGAGRAGRHGRVRARAGGGRARAAADRRAPAPLQPPLPRPAPRLVGHDARPRRSRGCRWCPRRGRARSARSGRRQARGGRRRAGAGRRAAARRARRASRRAEPGPARARCTSWGAAPRRAPGCRRRTGTRPPSSPGRPGRRPRRRRAAAPSRTRSPRRRRERFETAARRRDRLAGLVAGARPCAAAGRARRRRRAGRRPARTGAAAGSSPWCATAGLAAAGVAPRAACRRCRWSTRCGRARRRCCPGPGRCAGPPPRRCGILPPLATAGGTRLVLVARRRGRSRRAGGRELTRGVGAPRAGRCEVAPWTATGTGAAPRPRHRLGWPRDHRDRPGACRRRPDPRGRAGHRRPRRGGRGLLLRRRRRPDRDRAGRAHEELADVIAGRLSKVAGRAPHRHPHRLPLVCRDGPTPRPTLRRSASTTPDRHVTPRRVTDAGRLTAVAQPRRQLHPAGQHRSPAPESTRRGRPRRRAAASAPRTSAGGPGRHGVEGHQRAGGVEQHRVAHRPGSPASTRAERPRRSPRRRRRAGRRAVARGHAERRRVDDARAAPRRRRPPTPCGGRVVSSSSPSSPRTTSADAPRPANTSASTGASRGVGARRPAARRRLGRVGERAEHVDRRRTPSSRARRRGVPHRRVEHRREAEPDAGLVHARGHRRGRQVDGHAERLQHVRGAAGRRRGPVAVLDHRHARPPRRRRRPSSRC